MAICCILWVLNVACLRILSKEILYYKSFKEENHAHMPDEKFASFHCQNLFSLEGKELKAANFQWASHILQSESLIYHNLHWYSPCSQLSFSSSTAVVLSNEISMARTVIYSRADLSGKLMGLSCPLKYPLTLPPVMRITCHNKSLTEQVHFATASPLKQNAICLFFGSSC